ncbi:hypothetical protein GCM10011519_32660 [Marmoricola endophyticus]|uniref:Uncharacterized protein n=1 Tax=Marmoricola endophyticus TaxID=2040280 RepID=A0A917BTK0_9ACTN|nr:hypothetical protein [Marmoricola endophyticus]GGF56189.1 hypothetical protein GCM10011519_32660 [Marmoricola endophyticus]
MTPPPATPSNLGRSLAQARQAHATPTPSPGDLWRARWNDQAGVLLVLDSITTPRGAEEGGSQVNPGHLIRVAAVSLDSDADETAAVAAAETNTLHLELAVWVRNEATVPVRVLDYKLGELTADLMDLPPGDLNWGATDPRTIARARQRDLLDLLAEAEWAPSGTGNLDLDTVLKGADPRAVAAALGSVPRAAALRRGQVDLSQAEANSLAEVLQVPAATLLSATNPPLPEDLVAAMDLPEVRSLVHRLAARRDQDEVETWRTAAYGVQALAAREHNRRDVRWSARIIAYFDAQLGEQRGPDQ